MAKRDDLMAQFGPKLLEAAIVVLLDETNRLRAHVGMPQVTLGDFYDEITNHITELEPYEWQDWI